MTARNAEARRKDWDPEPEADDTAGAVPRAGTAWRLATRLASHRGLLALGSMAVILSTAAELVEPRLFGYAIDAAIIPRDRARLTQLGMFFGLLTIVRALATVAEAYLFDALGQAVTQDLRVAVMSRLQRRQPPSQLNGRRFDQAPEQLGSAKCKREVDE